MQWIGLNTTSLLASLHKYYVIARWVLFADCTAAALTSPPIIVSVEKPGKDPSLAANYRPISLLSVCYKLLERLALQRISPAVEGLLSPDQAGFRKCRSTCDQVAALTTFIENGFQQNLKTGAVFLNLTAAYDTVWHTGLLCKLSESMPYWFTRLVGLLLRDRRFRVDMGNDTSSWRPQRNGLPQALSLHRLCSTCTPKTCQLHVAENSFTLTTPPFKVDTSAN